MPYKLTRSNATTRAPSFSQCGSMVMRVSTPRALDPFRAHFGDGAREQAAGVGQLGGHDPLWPFFCQRRARVDRQFDAARPLVIALARLGPRLGVIRLEADVAEQACQQCLMDGVVAGVLVVLTQTQFAHLRMQLAMNVA